MSFANATNPFAPSDEDMATLWLDRTNFIGAVLGGMAYGLHAVVVWLCFSSLWPKVSFRQPRSITTLAFIFVLFAMGTLNFSGNTAISQLMFVDNRMYPGGPTVYLMEHYDAPINVMGNAGYIVANFFTDATLLWRAFIVWNKSYLVILPPFLLFLASTTMSIFVLYQISQPTASLWTETSVNFTLSYFSMSIALNVFLTLLIAGRLLSMHNRVKQHLGSHHARTYTSVAAMMVECAVPYSALGLAFIATFALNSPAQNVILPVLSQVMCMSPELIIWRVAMGRAWAEGTTGVTYGSTVGSSASRTAGESTIQLSQLRFKTTQGTATQVGSRSDASLSKAAEIGSYA